MCDTSGWAGESVCTAQHAAALDSGFQSAPWHFSSSFASPSAASSLSLISGHNRELARSTCCLLHTHSCLKTHRRYRKSTSTCHSTCRAEHWSVHAEHEGPATALMMQCVSCVCVCVSVLLDSVHVSALCLYFLQPGSYFNISNIILGHLS